MLRGGRCTPITASGTALAFLTLVATVQAVEDQTVTLKLAVTAEGASKPVLGRATAVVDLSGDRA